MKNRSSLEKKSEVNDLLESIQKATIEKDEAKLRNLIKRVVSYMTLGIDVSDLFPEMVKATATRDLVRKKLLYHYISYYAELQPDLALLSVGTLHKDALDPNPMIRGLSLRCMSSFRVKDINEYFGELILKLLVDNNSYVRKNAILAAVKVNRISPQHIPIANLVARLQGMLKDKDCSVMFNALVALHEIFSIRTGDLSEKLILSRNTMIYLLNRLSEFPESAQCVILEILSDMAPRNPQELFAFFNLLDSKLRTSNSAIFLAVAKIFIKYSQSQQQLFSQVLERLKSNLMKCYQTNESKAPLITLMETSVPEISFVCLRHILAVVTIDKALFSFDYKHFFCRHDDTIYNKVLKIQILCEISNLTNFRAILSELCEYVKIPHQNDLVRESVVSIGKIAIKLPEALEACMSKLVSFLDFEDDSLLLAATVIAIKDVLRKYPQKLRDTITDLSPNLINIEDPEAKAAVVWILGEFGGKIPNSPYMLESLVVSYNEESSTVRRQLMTSLIKLFLFRPPECQPILAKLFENALNDPNFDIRDRSAFYYRCLTTQIDEARQIIFPDLNSDNIEITPKVSDSHSQFDLNYFNSLYIIFDRAHGSKLKRKLFEFSESEVSLQAPLPNLMDLTENVTPTKGAVTLKLNHSGTIEPVKFKEMWANLPVLGSNEVRYSSLESALDMDKQLTHHGIFCVAFGKVNEGQTKFFFAAQEMTEGHLFLVETNVHAEINIIKNQFKSTDPKLIEEFVSYFVQIVTKITKG